MKKSTVFVLWIGAAISISEIFTGGLLAPLGFAKGFAAIITGHLIGAALLGFGGLVAFARKKNAMECVALSFGSRGGSLIALCNVVQLAGWTIVMVVQAAGAIRGIFPGIPYSALALGLAILTLLWALLLGSPAMLLNNIIVVLLALLCGGLFLEKAGAVPGPGAVSGGMTLALAIELSIAMPISWLPLVGDYSCHARSKAAAGLMPFGGYFIASTLMYLFGLFVGLQGMDIFAFIAASRFRLLACAVVALSTLTTAFLDLYSAAVSSLLVFPGQKKVRGPILVIGLLAMGVSAFFPAEHYAAFLETFLLTIGSVFVPVYTALFLDFLFGRSEKDRPPGRLLAIAAAGIAAYHLFSRAAWLPEIIAFPTLLTMAVVAALYGVLRASARGHRGNCCISP
jgi:putative hydroxymethylpyrimidine transporter CytX